MPEHLVKLVMMLFADSKSRIIVARGLSEELPISVGKDERSAISPLQFILLIDETTEQCRGDEIYEILYTDDLLLTAVTKGEAEQTFFDWRQAIAIRTIKVNVVKSNMMVTNKKAEVVRSGRYPCAVCGKGVGHNSILCTHCSLLSHNRCSGVCNINSSPSFQCVTCRDQNQMEEPCDESPAGERRGSGSEGILFPR